MRMEWAMAALVTAAGGGGGAAPPSHPDDGTVAINFSQDVGWSGTVAMEVQQAGDSTCFTTYNHDGRPEIGVWQHPVAKERFAQLLALLKQSGYERIPTPSVVPPGTRAIVVGERKAGQAVPSIRTFPTLPPALAPVAALIETIRSELQAYPLRVLRGEATLKAGSVGRGGALVMELKLTNVGGKALSFSNPLSPTEGWNGLRLVLHPASGAEERQVDLSSADVSAGGQSRSPVLSLGPGQTVRFELHPKLDVPAGKYPARFEYHSMATPSDDAQFVGGTLAIPVGDITVKRAAWWKIW
jgi:hypothetical protein